MDSEGGKNLAPSLLRKQLTQFFPLSFHDLGYDTVKSTRNKKRKAQVPQKREGLSSMQCVPGKVHASPHDHKSPCSKGNNGKDVPSTPKENKTQLRDSVQGIAGNCEAERNKNRERKENNSRAESSSKVTPSGNNAAV
jgi:hypothetical protein